MRHPKLLTAIALLLTVLNASSQYYDTGQDPASVKWLQIKTDKFTVIYPENYGNGGKLYAASLNSAYLKLLTVFPEQKMNIPVVIHPYTNRSNGYVAWAPRRMELYPTPEQNTIPLLMEEQLAVHELAHVFEMRSLNTGFTRIMSLMLGEQVTGIAAALLPLWYLEGDAVYSESLLTSSGRGRTPSFSRQLKALSVERGKIYKYDKLLNGSYNDFIPSHYELGYQIVAWSKAKYGADIWNKALKFTGKAPYLVETVNLSLKKTTGSNKKRLFVSTFDSLRTIWSEEIKKDKAVTYSHLNPDKRGKYASYFSPVFAGPDSIIALKTSLDKPSHFVLLNPSVKKEKNLLIPGLVYPLTFSYAHGKIVWVETRNDPRWENRDYSVIRLMELKSRGVRNISRRSRYQSASLSPDGQKIVATENSIDNKNSIAILDATSGKILDKIPAPQNFFLQKPQWSDDGNMVTFIFLSDKGEGITAYEITGRKWKTLLEAGRSDLQSSLLRNDSLFYVTSLTGTENIFLKTPDGTEHRVTRSMFGANDIHLEGNNLIFSDYSSSGNNISLFKLNEMNNEETEIISPLFLPEIKDNPAEKHNVSVTDTNFTPVPYYKWQHMFNFHSWMPIYADLQEIKADPTAIRPGVTVLTQNTLSTIISQIGYEYSAEGRHMFHSYLSLKGRYPVFESRIDYGSTPKITKITNPSETISDPSIVKPGLRSSNSISLPLAFSSGRFSEYLQPSFSLDYRNDYIYMNGKYDYGQTILSSRIYFSNYRRSVEKDIFPRWAQVIDLNYSNAPFDKEFYGSISTIKTLFYFPGLFLHNSLKLRYESDNQSPVKFLFGNKASFPRGYKNIISKKLAFYSADYVFPVLYPDLSLSSIIYLKRIRAGLFYDYALGTGNYIFTYSSSGTQRVYHNYEESFISKGFEILTDFHFLRIPYPITTGIRTIWKKDNSSPLVELVFNIDLYGMTIGRKDRKSEY